MTELDELKNRIADPAHRERAQARADKIETYLKANTHRLQTLEDRVRQTPGMPKRVHWLRQAAAVLGEAAKGNTYCHTGCAGCCHMPTHLSLDEARVIAKETGATLTEPAVYTHGRDEDFNAIPCTFLEGGKCSIYAARPLSCRLHYVVSDDDALCQIIKGEAIHAPHFNASPFHGLYAMAHLKKGMTRPEDVKMADIREFFPTGLHPAA